MHYKKFVALMLCMMSLSCGAAPMLHASEPSAAQESIEAMPAHEEEPALPATPAPPASAEQSGGTDTDIKPDTASSGTEVNAPQEGQETEKEETGAGADEGSNTPSEPATEDVQGQESGDGQNTDDTAAPDANANTKETEKAEDEQPQQKEPGTEKADNSTVKKPAEDPDSAAEAVNKTGSNQDILLRQRIVRAPAITMDFRFYFKKAEKLYAKEGIDIYEEMSDGATKVGRLYEGNSFFELKDIGNGWTYIESGDVRGFARTSGLGMTRADLDNLIKTKSMSVEELGGLYIPSAKRKDVMLRLQEAESTLRDLTDNAGATADVLVRPEQNKALCYIMATARETAEKKAVISVSEVNVFEKKDKDAKVVGTSGKDTMFYVLCDEGDWYFVESGDVRGFIEKASVKAADEKDGRFGTAVPRVSPAENKALYHTTRSVKYGDPESELRYKMLQTAVKCLGHPYVWGGTDPAGSGADCSGFVQWVYRQYGYNLPRVAQDQAYYSGGIKIPVSDAAPGDLIFFSRNGYIYHVAMCLSNNGGDVDTIEAYGRNYGIITSSVGGRDAIWAVRVLQGNKA